MPDPLFTLPSYWPLPDLSQAAFVAPNAVIVGDVEIAQGASIWYSAVVRGDVEKIRIGAYSNIQDGAVLHGDPGEVTCLEEYVTIGHRAVIHGAHIERACLIGIGAVILNGIRVGTGSLIGAGAIVNKDVPPRSLVVGVPARRVRDLSEEEADKMVEHAKRYQQLALVHSNQGNNLGFTNET
ncbi:gamma carbonic anhydrase family protein [Crocosphaera sp. Alani8]|uniref:gamma carbonic anhydrase family protein n=1 Tax=Crocosphaera sp. Alani8 TaxID=3038952 RepID=UPI00313DD012